MPAQRGSRTTQRQFELLLSLMESRRRLISGKLDTNFTVNDRKRLWQEVSDSLNAADVLGSNKCPEKWRKTWNDWKANVKSKAISLRKQALINEECIPSDHLSPLEERLLNLIGWPGISPSDSNNKDDDGNQHTNRSLPIIGGDDDNTLLVTVLETQADFKDENMLMQHGVATETGRQLPEQVTTPPSTSRDPSPESTRSDTSEPEEILPNHPVTPIVTLHEQGTSYAGWKRKRCREKTVGELLANKLNNFEEKKIDVLERIAKATERKAVAEERKAAAEERKAAAEERKAAALQDIAAALIRRPLSL